MKKIESDFRYFAPPDINAMYNYLFICMEQWSKADDSAVKASQATKDSPNIPDAFYLSSAFKYSVITSSYTLLDAVIHTYVAINGFEASENESDNSVYSKWKNFPYPIQRPLETL